MKTYGELITDVLGALGIYETPDSSMEVRFLQALKQSLKDISSLGLRYYHLDFEINTPASVAIAFTRQNAHMLKSVVPAPVLAKHRYGFVEIAGEWYTIMGIDEDDIYVTPEVPVGVTSGTLISGGYYFGGSDKAIPIILDDNIITDWRIETIEGVEGLEYRDLGEFSIEWRNSGQVKYWRQDEQGVLLAPCPTSEDIFHVLLQRLPYIITTYDADAIVDIPESLDDKLILGTAYYYKLYSGDGDFKGMKNAFNEALEQVKLEQVQLTGDRFKNIPGIREYNTSRR